MIRKERNGIAWLEFELFQGMAGIVHALFLRQGGVSPKPFDSLNFSVFCGDTQENRDANVRLALDSLGVEEYFVPHLVHGTNVLSITRENKREVLEGDGISTSVRELALMTTFADCQCALLYDPVKRVVGNIHAGWRGCVQNIYQKAVHHFVEIYASDPGDLLVGIGPSLGPDRAEFRNYTSEIPVCLHSYRVGENHFDFWAIARDQLIAAGVRPAHIELAQLCTYSDKESFFSYRRDSTTGRHAGFIALV